MENRITFNSLFEKNAWRFRCQLRKIDISRPDNDLFQEGLMVMWKPFEPYQPDDAPLAIYFTCITRHYLTDSLTGKVPLHKRSA
ncbi:sigma-70 family RNA polymerase sigma factor [Virgibacillus ihumii]|uniref:sigma-70 family RNA polymerase sigma factor n=1 Tax=Virgibacillus ihumii TaxID=2686091 RepID=UPI00157CD6A7|nr:sigma-70 family RNA polymerase sigma factor [Virgibacillus ihumii]